MGRPDCHSAHHHLPALFLTPLLAPLPTVALGAIIIVASLGLIDIGGRSASCGRCASCRVLAGGSDRVGVLIVGVLAGILVAVVLSLIMLLYRMARPHDALLDDVDVAGGTVYRGVADKETVMTEPGLIVYRFDAPLVFANAAYFTDRLTALVANAGAGLKCVILDAEPISDFDSTACGGVGEPGCRPGAGRRRLVDRGRGDAPLRELLTAYGTDETAWRGAPLSFSARSRGGVSRTIRYDLASPVKTFRVCETLKVWLSQRAGWGDRGDYAERNGLVAMVLGRPCTPNFW